MGATNSCAKIDTNFAWKHHVNDLYIKMNRANALHFKMRKYVSLKILTSIQFAIFDSYLSYCCLVCAQSFSTIQQILISQKNVVRITIFQPRNLYTCPLFKQNCILKFAQKNISVFNTRFGLVFSQISITNKTSRSTQGNLMKLFYKTNRYGKY